MPAAVTEMEAVVAAVLQSKLPVELVDKVEVPLQLSTTFTTGAEGVVFGAAVPVPAALVQPFTDVWMTLYVPAPVTVIEDVVSAVLHSNAPVATVDKTEVPLQLLTTVTTGAAGVTNGADVPVPAPLIHPFTVWVTV